MFPDSNGELKSPIKNNRLPSLMALRCFEVAARLQNFTRAAKELYLTHGAISRAVRTLEDDLGVQLFERRSRRVFLTEDGRKLAQAVHDGLALIKLTTDELRNKAHQKQQWVLSCEPTLLMRWLIPRWPEFQRLYPMLNIHLVAGGGQLTFSNGIDMAIRRDDFIWPDGYFSEPLFTEKVGPVCHPDKVTTWFHRSKEQVQLTTEAPRLHTNTRLDAWQCWSNLTGTNISAPATEQIFEHFYFSLQAAVAGLGVAIGPWHLVCDDIDSGVLSAPLDFVADGSQYCLLTPQEIKVNSPQVKLLAWLKTQV